MVFGLMLLLVTAMSVGVLMGKKPIAGSCGGMSSLGMEVACDVCGGDKTKCENEDEYEGDFEDGSNSLAYDALANKH